MKLYNLTSNDKYKDFAERQLNFISSQASQYPTNHAMFLSALLEYNVPSIKVNIVTDYKTDIKDFVLDLPSNAIINLLTESAKEYSLKNGKPPTMYVKEKYVYRLLII